MVVKGKLCSSTKGNHHLLTTELIEDCEDVSSLEFKTSVMARPSAVVTAPFETETGRCMHFRPIREPNEVISAKSVRTNVCVR